MKTNIDNLDKHLKRLWANINDNHLGGVFDILSEAMTELNMIRMKANGAEQSSSNCNITLVSPRLFYVVAPSQYEEGNLEQITNGLTYERAVAYRDGKFCKNRYPNAYILASLNEG